MRNTYCQPTLTHLQLQLITGLIEDCRKAEPLRLAFPDDGSLFLFICDEQKALSVIIACKLQEDIWECYAFTRPEYRRQGLFTCLLDNLCEEAPPDTELIFLLDHQSPGALAAVLHMDMELWRTEHKMERKINRISALFSGVPSLRLQTKEITEDETPGWLFSAFLPADKTAAPTFLGSCRILAYGDLRFYLCHVEIAEPFRCQGWGTQLINAVLCQLPNHSSLSLQVSADNTAAVNLYKKTGFHLTETLSYYLY